MRERGLEGGQKGGRRADSGRWLCRSRGLRRYNMGMGEAQSPRGQFSLGGTLGAGAGTAFRLLRGKPGRNKKLLGGVRAGVSGFTKPLMSVLRVLFLEVSGVIFLFISLAVLGRFVGEYKKYAMHQVGWERVALAGALGALFLYFGVSSFWRARRKRSRI
jgi:hypothetical protein